MFIIENYPISFALGEFPQGCPKVSPCEFYLSGMFSVIAMIVHIIFEKYIPRNCL